MIGEPEDCAIGALDAPAPRQRGGAVVEMGLQASGEGFHRRTSISGMDVIEPSRSKSRVTSSLSVSKRTGTSNSKPAVIRSGAKPAMVAAPR